MGIVFFFWDGSPLGSWRWDILTHRIPRFLQDLFLGYYEPPGILEMGAPRDPNNRIFFCWSRFIIEYIFHKVYFVLDERTRIGSHLESRISQALLPGVKDLLGFAGIEGVLSLVEIKDLLSFVGIKDLPSFASWSQGFPRLCWDHGTTQICQIHGRSQGNLSILLTCAI
nr:hypothetical protein CFP56_29319 [Quercus suber]